jgi:hypothetical protein
MSAKVDYSDNDFFAKNYSGWAKWKFYLKIKWNYRKADRRLEETLRRKECFYGPFKGEFGHFLAHNLPFLMFLHSKGVKINYCGMDLHRPFLVDESGNSIISEYTPLRDFFGEVTPSCNKTIPPADVQTAIQKWQQRAEQSGLPYWNIDNEYYYWFIHRNWLLQGSKTYAYRLDKVYGSATKENSVCVFPRSKGGKSSLNNGGPWDYADLIDKIAPYFDKVYVCGHPSQVLSIAPHGNVELCVTADNGVILEKCSKSKLIITQHSGVNNLGEYTNTKVLIIYNGSGPIGSMQNTFRFRPYIAGKGKQELHPLSFAYSEKEVLDFIRTFKDQI